MKKTRLNIKEVFRLSKEFRAICLAQNLNPITTGVKIVGKWVKKQKAKAQRGASQI
jgi:hypothetical protein